MTDVSDELALFAAAFHSTVLAQARGEDRSEDMSFKEEAFTELFIGELAQTGAITEGHVCHFDRKVGNAVLRVDGYYFDEEEEERLDLFVTIYSGDGAPREVSRDEVTRAVKGAMRFYEHAVAGVHEKMEPSDDAFSMVQRVHEVSKGLSELRVFVLTDGLAKEFSGSKGVALRKGLAMKVHVWDIQRLSRCVATGGSKESIEVNFVQEFGAPIPCLPVNSEGAGYSSYLAVFPALVLYRLYEDYGERLLELNVRSFLQARGKINQNIRKAILEEPQHFFAYNNGLTAIAEQVITAPLQGGGVGIASLRGLQIVNGGQTTASIHRAGKKDGAMEKLASISVQTKLSVIDAGLVEEMVPRISLYANSQNKVNEADFSANDPYHQALERLSRQIWTPDGLQHWFYERARGQYQVARARDGRTPAAIKKFDAINPPSQMFSKTDLASSEQSWRELPHIVSRGGQKNFREFTLALARSAVAQEPDDASFKELVARLMLFRTTQRLARESKIGAYRANVVTYAVAYLANRVGLDLDLKAVWERQLVPKPVEQLILSTLEPIGALIVATAGTRNVTEWAKREECWRAVSAARFPATESLIGGLPRRTATAAAPPSGRRLTALADAARIAKEAGLEVIDKSSAGGAVWIVGGTSLKGTLDDIGIAAVYRQEGGKASEGRPAWYLK